MYNIHVCMCVRVFRPLTTGKSRNKQMLLTALYVPTSEARDRGKSNNNLRTEHYGYFRDVDGCLGFRTVRNNDSTVCRWSVRSSWLGMTISRRHFIVPAIAFSSSPFLLLSFEKAALVFHAVRWETRQNNMYRHTPQQSKAIPVVTFLPRAHRSSRCSMTS